MNRISWFGAVLAGLLVMSGCSTVHRSYQAVADKGHEMLRWYKSSDDNLVKTVGVAWVSNQSGYPVADFEMTYTAQLADRLRAEGGRLRIVSAAEPSAPEILQRLPRTPEGRIDNFDLALMARQHGMDAVVIAALIDVRDRRQERGIWWFKDVYDYIDITMDIEVYDSETGAKLIDERLTHAIEADIPMIMPSQPSAETLPAQVFDEIGAMLPQVARRVTDVMALRPWVGFIREVSGKRVVLSAGADTGLKPGDILEVFDNTRVIQGVDDVHFFVPGAKIGEIEITASLPDRIEARTLSDAVLWAGSPVKLKD